MSLLDSSDVIVLSIELIVLVGYLLSLIVTIIIYHKNKRIISISWLWFIGAQICLFLHSLFDALDTLNWQSEYIDDWFDLFDGILFVVGVVVISIALFLLVKKEKEIWSI